MCYYYCLAIFPLFITLESPQRITILNVENMFRMLSESCADLGVFLVEVGAKAKVMQVNWLVFAFVCKVGHLLWRGNLEE